MRRIANLPNPAPNIQRNGALPDVVGNLACLISLARQRQIPNTCLCFSLCLTIGTVVPWELDKLNSLQFIWVPVVIPFWVAVVITFWVAVVIPFCVAVVFPFWVSVVIAFWVSVVI
jgi:hypothetical protein